MTPDVPLAKAVDVYYARGWHLIPVVIDPRTNSKAPASAGTTGARGEWLTADEVKEGLTHHRGTWPGIGIRPEPGVLGLDVDDYGGRVGARVIRDLSEDTQVGDWGWKGLGRLPSSWRSSARPDPVSGIYWYRYDPGLWRPVRDVGDNVELIRWDHRFGVASPTIHPTGEPYRWFTPDGSPSAAGPPNVEDLPWLPDPWLHHIEARQRPTGTGNGAHAHEEGWYIDPELAAYLMSLAVEGRRHHTLFGLAMDLHRAGLDTGPLRQAAIGRGFEAWDVDRHIKNAERRVDEGQ